MGSVVAAPRLWSTGSVVVVHRLNCSAACGVFPIRDRTHVSCMGRRILNHWTTREALRSSSGPKVKRAGNDSSFLHANLFLALKCPSGSRYSPCANPCPGTCLSLSTPSYCPSSLPCAEGCECQRGHILSGTTCVPLSECGCTSPGGAYHPVRSQTARGPP